MFSPSILLRHKHFLDDLDPGSLTFILIHFMGKQMQKDNCSPLSVVGRQQSQEAEDSLAVVEKEFRQQQQAMQSVLAEVAQLESTKTISGDYELKLQRQGYFLSKQMIVSSYFLSRST